MLCANSYPDVALLVHGLGWVVPRFLPINLGVDIYVAQERAWKHSRISNEEAEQCWYCQGSQANEF